jgi:hypothetical protein
LPADFPRRLDLRQIVIELLAQRHAVENFEEEPGRIDEAIEEARDILDERRSP